MTLYDGLSCLVLSLFIFHEDDSVNISILRSSLNLVMTPIAVRPSHKAGHCAWCANCINLVDRY